MASEDAQEVRQEQNYTALLFSYAANLSPTTLKQRLPGSLYCGLAELKDHKFVINSTGYANIIESPGDNVYGSLAFLSSRDEKVLDDSEDVPYHYTKHQRKVMRLGDGLTPTGQEVQALTYIDMQRQDVGSIEKDYVVYINKMIREGIMLGIPESYFEKYVRPFLPDDRNDDITMIRTVWTENESVKDSPQYKELGSGAKASGS